MLDGAVLDKVVGTTVTLKPGAVSNPENFFHTVNIIAELRTVTLPDELRLSLVHWEEDCPIRVFGWWGEEVFVALAEESMHRPVRDLAFG